MSTNIFSHRKPKFSIVALVVILIAVVSVSFGTIIYSAAPANPEKVQEEIPAPEKTGFRHFFSQAFFPNSAPPLSPEATFTVNNDGDTKDAAPGNGTCADANGDCTLRAAIEEANAKSGADTIVFDLTYPATIQLDSAPTPASLEITETVTITGPNARLLTVSGNASTVDGVFRIKNTVATAVSISRITVSGSNGHGVNNEGKLNLADVAIKANKFGVYNSGTLDLTRLTINNNSSGGIFLAASSAAAISNTTITNNDSPDHGGGVHSLSGNVTLNNVTISHNTAATSGGGFYFKNAASGVNVRNTIIANNTAPTGPDILSATTDVNFMSRGNNLIGKSASNIGFEDGKNGDKVGTTGTPVDPLLGSLQNNGGQIDTRAIEHASPAKDAGNNCVTDSSCQNNNPSSNLTTDQRGTGFPRKNQANVDIGAFELFYPVAVISDLSPTEWGTGKGAFELTINGDNFVSGSIVKFNGQERPTTFVSNTQLKAQISASDVQTAGQFPVIVVNPDPNGSDSNAVNFIVIDCAYSISPTSQTFNASGGSGTITVTATNGCAWTAATSASWIKINGANSGNGNGTISFTVEPNSGAPRTGTITIGGQTFNITQSGACTFTLNPTSADYGASGGGGNFSVATETGCAWTAVSNSPWIKINTGSGSGTGNGTVSYTVEANAGQARQGTITVNGKTFTINQANGCTFAIAPQNADIPAAGGTNSFTVTPSDGGCTWTAVSNAPWITVTPTTTQTGTATVNYTVAANNGSARQGTITAGGKTFTVNQASGCAFTLSLAGTTYPASGGSGSFDLNASNQSCTWTAVSSVPWVTFISATSGTGDATIQYTVAPNINPERKGKITVGGKDFEITQENGCTFSIAPSSKTAPAGGGTNSFNINSGAGCSWTAQSNDSWITLASGSDSGSGSKVITYTVAANAGPARQGTITAGGKTFNINQDSGCNFTLSVTSLTVPAAGGNRSVDVTASDGRCTWTATTSESWLKITSATNQTGNGSVQFTVEANISPERTGTINIGGKTLTVIQSNGCVYSISPTSLYINENGGSRSFNVISGPNCIWTAASNDSWITITAGATGSGNGTVTFSVAASSGQERVGTISAAGHTFTVNQISLRVTNLNDSGDGSLRKAVSNANISPGDDVITFAPSVGGIIRLTSGEIEIINNGSLEIKGPGTYVLTISGNNNSRIFFTNRAKVTITDITLTGGNGVGKNSDNTRKHGGAIYVDEGSVTINRVQMINNTMSVSASSGQRNIGGGIFFNDGADHFILNSLFYNNNSTYAGGVYNQFGDLEIINSTFYGNTADIEGGAVYSSGNTSLRNSTITKNRSLGSNPQGAGVIIYGSDFTMRNTIITENEGAEISFLSGAFMSQGNNLIGDTAGDSTNTVNAVIYFPSDIRDTAPGLGPLARYGGPTPTVAVLSTSPALNAGSNANAPVTDQRGFQRIISGNIDIGAYESNIMVSPANNVLPNASVGTYYSQAISAARLGGTNATDPLLFSLVDSSLPPGLSISAAGLIQGTPTANGVYTFTVIANGNDEMAGANQYTISVGCSYSINPTSQLFNANGGDGSVNLTTSNGCSWTSTSNAAWIKINSGSSGNGTGAVSFTVQPNSGGSRTGTINIAGQTFTVNQQSGCVFSLVPNNAGSPASGMTGNFKINTSDGCSWTAVSNDAWISISSGTSGTGTGTISFTVAPNNEKTPRTGKITAAGLQFTINQEATPFARSPVVYDFDGDKKSDISVYRPADGVWHLFQSGSGYKGVQFGISTDKLVPADYDGDGKTDIAVFRENPNNPEFAHFFIFNSSTGTVQTIQFGTAGDIPVAGDWDGDGRSDIAVYRSGAQGYFFYRPSSQAGVNFLSIPWGMTGDKPVASDFDGDGKTDPAVFRPSNGAWYVQKSRDGFYAIQFGIAEDKPVTGDYDGDGKTDFAVYRPSVGTWFLWQSTAGFAAAPFGLATDLPVPADYDGDSKTDIAVYRNGTWYQLNSSSGFSAAVFGNQYDKPVQNSFVR
jgi:CSLREA domain-containing protein